MSDIVRKWRHAPKDLRTWTRGCSSGAGVGGGRARSREAPPPGAGSIRRPLRAPHALLCVIVYMSVLSIRFLRIARVFKFRKFTKRFELN